MPDVTTRFSVAYFKKNGTREGAPKASADLFDFPRRSGLAFPSRDRTFTSSSHC